MRPLLCPSPRFHFQGAKRCARSRVARVGCCLLLIGAGAPSPWPTSQAQAQAQAQDQIQDEGAQKGQDEESRKRDQFFETSFRVLASTDAQAALQAARQFLADNPRMQPRSRLQFYSMLASRLISLSAPERHAQAVDLALGVLDEGLAQASVKGSVGYMSTPAPMLMLVNTKIRLLLSEKRWEQVEAQLQQSDALAVRCSAFDRGRGLNDDSYLVRYLRLKIRALKEQNRGAQVPAMLTSFALRQIATRRQAELSLCEFMVGQMIEADRPSEALTESAGGGSSRTGTARRGAARARAAPCDAAASSPGSGRARAACGGRRSVAEHAPQPGAAQHPDRADARREPLGTKGLSARPPQPPGHPVGAEHQ